MEKQQKRKRTDMTSLREIISPEFNLIKTSETMGGALTHLAPLFIKIRSLPTVNQIIALAEAELAKEDRIAFENLEKAVAWFQEKIRLLLPHVKWEPDSFARAEINALLNFHTISFNANGYVGSLLFALKHLFSEVAQEEKNYPLFEGWTQADEGTDHFVFDWPEYVNKSLNALPIEERVSQWKERADTSLPFLLRFLKTLTLYPTFVPLVLPARPILDSLPKNLRELEEKQYQAYVGYYLSTFRLPAKKKPPLSNTGLVTMIDRFLCMLEQKIGSNLSETTAAHPVQIKIVINQFLYFSSNASKEDEIAPDPSFQKQASCPKTTTSNKKTNWRSEQCDQDIAAFMSYAIKLWKEEIPKYTYPIRIGKKTLARKLLDKFPAYISLYSKGENRFPRALKAIEITDPRIYDNRGNYSGLKPHWEKFEWVKI